MSHPRQALPPSARRRPMESTETETSPRANPMPANGKRGTVNVWIHGLRLETPNSRRGRTRGAAMAHDHYVKTTRTCVQLHVAAIWRRRDRLTSIHCVRVSPGTLDDDGLVACFKAPLDAIARAIGVNDRDFVIVGNRPGIPVTFAQEKDGQGRYSVRLELGFETPPMSDGNG